MGWAARRPPEPRCRCEAPTGHPSPLPPALPPTSCPGLRGAGWSIGASRLRLWPSCPGPQLGAEVGQALRGRCSLAPPSGLRRLLMDSGFVPSQCSGRPCGRSTRKPSRPAGPTTCPCSRQRSSVSRRYGCRQGGHHLTGHGGEAQGHLGNAGCPGPQPGVGC